MNAFTTHPSVRIKGTENNYEPVQCMAPHCSNKAPHMHCPFCTKTESFVDPVILKAHYRVKHVDKGIEFAGLKVLRCCDHCDIVGTIKGVKEFKGAHWHCYKCKNGFNRRDEAIKHYRTHFRNPQTTFQIQITQEINQMYPLGHEVETAAETLAQQDLTTIHPALTEAVMCTTATEMMANHQQQETVMSNGRPPDGEVHVSVAANETVDTSEGQTIMIIQEDNQLDSSQEHHVQQENCTFQITNTAGGVQQLTAVEEPKSDLEHRVFELQQRNEQLEVEKAQLEQELDQLKIQVQMQGQEVSAYQKREQDLLAQLSIPLDERIHELLNQLKTDHEDLLHQQLALLRKTYLSQLQQAGEAGELSQQENIIIVTSGEERNGTMSCIRVPTDGTLVEEAAAASVRTSDVTTSSGSGDGDVSKSSVVTSSSSELAGNQQTVTLTSEQFHELEAASEVHEHTSIVITDDMVEPPAKRKKET